MPGREQLSAQVLARTGGKKPGFWGPAPRRGCRWGAMAGGEAGQVQGVCTQHGEAGRLEQGWCCFLEAPCTSHSFLEMI